MTFAKAAAEAIVPDPSEEEGDRKWRDWLELALMGGALAGTAALTYYNWDSIKGGINKMVPGVDTRTVTNDWFNPGTVAAGAALHSASGNARDYLGARKSRDAASTLLSSKNNDDAVAKMTTAVPDMHPDEARVLRNAHEYVGRQRAGEATTGQRGGVRPTIGQQLAGTFTGSSLYSDAALDGFDARGLAGSPGTELTNDRIRELDVKLRRGIGLQQAGGNRLRHGAIGAVRNGLGWGLGLAGAEAVL